jgi:hypothetical protein
VDVIRCRFNGFVQNVYDLPVYAPTDEIKPAVEGCLGDYHWVDIGPLGPRRSERAVLPYFGPAFYGRATVDFLLDAGIATWADAQLTFNASGHKPASHLADRFRTLERIWL